MQAKRSDTRHGEMIPSMENYARTVSPVAALRKLYELLEAYSPMWYTQEAHELAQAALGEQTIQ